MQELIDRHALKNHLYRAQAEAFKRSEWYVAGSIQSFIDILDKQPTIESEPVRHGRWIPICVSKRGLTDTFECSECGRTTVTIYKTSKCEKAYCWNCGARMDGGADDD